MRRSIAILALASALSTATGAVLAQSNDAPPRPLRAVHAGPRPRPPPPRSPRRTAPHRPRRRAPRRTKRPGPPSRRRKPSSPGNSSRTPRPARSNDFAGGAGLRVFRAERRRGRQDEERHRQGDGLRELGGCEIGPGRAERGAAKRHHCRPGGVRLEGSDRLRADRAAEPDLFGGPGGVEGSILRRRSFQDGGGQKDRRLGQ